MAMAGATLGLYVHQAQLAQRPLAYAAIAALYENLHDDGE